MNGYAITIALENRPVCSPPATLCHASNDFCRDHLNTYVNFHRPCLFAETITDAEGKQRKRYPYRLMITTYKKLKSLPEAETFLKLGVGFKHLDAQAKAMSDNDAAEQMNAARSVLFKTIFNRSKTADP